MVLGLLVLGVALWLGLGVPGLVGYVGGLLLVGGLALAWYQARHRQAAGG